MTTEPTATGVARNPWELYDRLIAGVPDDIRVVDYCLGRHWTYVEAECGMGISWTATGGASRTCRDDLRGAPLAKVATLAKSWCFEEASLGIAALNAYYARRELLDALGARYDERIDMPDGTVRKMDAFEQYRPQMQGADVVVVGHFPHVDRIAEYAHLTVLERNVRSAMDTPDPACEYVVPTCDYLFMTGVTLTNKTAPRLLELSKNAHTVLVGPSVVMSPALFDWGAEMLAGSVVNDPEAVRMTVKAGTGRFFGEAVSMLTLAQGEAKK